MNLRILNLCLIISFFPLIIEAKEIFFECPYDKNYLEDGWEDLTDEKTTDGRIYTHEYMIDLERGEGTFTKNQDGWKEIQERMGRGDVLPTSINSTADEVFISYCAWKDYCSSDEMSVDVINRETLLLRHGPKRQIGVCKIIEKNNKF